MAVRWGIIGCGDVADRKAGPALARAPGSALVAVMRRNLSLAQAFARKHGAKRAYGSIEQLLADPEVDAVYVATPPHLHKEHVIQAVQAGKHVLCEKPMALSGDECAAMIQAARAAGVKLMVAYYRRFWPKVAIIKRLVDTGAIGDVVYAHVAVGEELRVAAGEQPWRLDPQQAGGGPLADIGSHRIDLLLHLLGDVTEVHALVGAQVRQWPVEDGAALLLKFASGAYASLHAHWNCGTPMDALEVYGTGGRVVATPLGGAALLVDKRSGAARHEAPAPEVPHWHAVAHFVHCIVHDEEPLVNGEEGAKTTRILDQAYAALRGRLDEERQQ